MAGSAAKSAPACWELGRWACSLLNGHEHSAVIPCHPRTRLPQPSSRRRRPRCRPGRPAAGAGAAVLRRQPGAPGRDGRAEPRQRQGERAGPGGRPGLYGGNSCSLALHKIDKHTMPGSKSKAANPSSSSPHAREPPVCSRQASGLPAWARVQVEAVAEKLAGPTEQDLTSLGCFSLSYDFHAGAPYIYESVRNQIYMGAGHAASRADPLREGCRSNRGRRGCGGKTWRELLSPVDSCNCPAYPTPLSFPPAQAPSPAQPQHATSHKKHHCM